METEEILSLYRKFYMTWVRCESNRGCYSCCESHDVRCPKAFHPDSCSKCVCGRSELESLEEQINALEAVPPAKSYDNEAVTL